jgi:hypothetical protein
MKYFGKSTLGENSLWACEASRLIGGPNGLPAGCVSTFLFIIELLGLVMLLVDTDVAIWRDGEFRAVPVADTRLSALGKCLAADMVRRVGIMGEIPGAPELVATLSDIGSEMTS